MINRGNDAADAMKKLFLPSLLITIALLFLLLNYVVEKSAIIGGISLVETIADEFRINIMPAPGEGFSCMRDDGFEPLCSRDFYGHGVRIPTSKVHINSLGFRDREYEVVKPDNAYRIFVLGDSFTFGWGVNNGEAYPEVLERELDALYNATTFEVLNLGFRRSFDDHYNTLTRYWNLSADLVIVQTLGNDPIECEGTLEELMGTNPRSIDESDAFTIAFEGFFSTRSIEEQCSCVRKYKTRIAELLEEKDIPLLIFDLFGHSCFNGTSWNEWVFNPELPQPRNEFISRGDPHPNARGHRKIAHTLLPEVIMIINETSPEVLH